MLDELREIIGRPIKVNCGVRCHKHNYEVGGTPESRHLPIHGENGDMADAADITIKNITQDEIDLIGELFDGTKYYRSKNFVHVDVRGYKARW